MGRLVSIVLPTYNGARYLRESIRTCLEQTYADIELVVVDDCSTDETPSILDEYRDDPRVRVIRHEENAKLPAALNTGFAHTSGAYLTWTSDDNLYVPHAIATMVEHLEAHPDVGFVYSDYWLIDEHGELIRRVQAGPPEHLKERCAITSFVYRREVYQAVGDYDTGLFRIEDYDYWLRVAQRFNLSWLSEPLYYYRRHASSLTGTDQLEARARRFDQLQSRFYGPDPTRQDRVLAGYYVAEAFERHHRGDRRGVLRFGTRAIRKDLSLCRNRGVLSILLRAAVGNGVIERVSRLTGRGA